MTGDFTLELLAERGHDTKSVVYFALSFFIAASATASAVMPKCL